MTVLGIVAGGGELPRAVAQSVRAAGRDVFVVALTAEEWTAQFPHEAVSIGEPGRAFKALKKAGARDVLLAGRVQRPKFSEIRLDTRGAMVLPRVIAAARQGDDALLRTMVALFEEEGFHAVSVPEAAPGLVCGEGALTHRTPDAEQWADIARGFAIVRALGALDVGQAAAVCEGLALAVEAAEGTDAMIARVAALPEALRGTAAKRRGVLVKALKTTQDARTDMPVIGVETVRGAAAAGLAGIALEAGHALVMGKAEVAAEADRLGLFVAGVAP